MQAEAGVTKPKPGASVGHQQPPEARRETRKGFSLRASRGNQPCRHLGFGLLASRNGREYISVVLSCQVCGNNYGSPGKRIDFNLPLFAWLLVITSLFSVFRDQPIMDISYTCHVVFCDWLLSFNMTFSRFIHVVRCIGIPFLFMDE